MVNRDIFLLLLCLFFTDTSGHQDAKDDRPPPENSRPNIVLIVADDLGWNDVGWHNSEVITPNLDRLAKNGVILDNSYVQSMCTPSRGALLSGKYPHKLGLQNWVIGSNEPKILPRGETLLPQLLQKVGYITHLVGKWHLGQCSDDIVPTSRGYDTFYGLLQSHQDFYTRRLDMPFNEYIYDFWKNDNITFPPYGSYNTDLFTERAVEIINEHNQSSPFFLTLAYTSPHFPLQVPQQYKDMYPDVKDDKRKTYLGMVSSLDDGVAKVEQALKNSGQMENTIVIFISDNGGDTHYGASNYPLRGEKGNLWEGGTKSAGFVYSPGYIYSPKCTYHGLIHAVDWFKTILDMANYNKETPTGLDSLNQWPFIRKCRGSTRNEFVYQINDVTNTAAIRVGNYKLIRGDPRVIIGILPYSTLVNPNNNETSLYDLEVDPFEQYNLADKKPKTVKRLKKRLDYYRQYRVSDQTQPRLPATVTAPNGILQLGWC